MKNVLIIGAGLAGSILADKLAKKVNVKIIDAAAGQTSSLIAAGLYNPVTGRRMNKSWLIDTLNPIAQDYYKNKEQEFGIQLIKSFDMLRFFHNSGMAKEWSDKIDFFSIQEIIAQNLDPNTYSDTFFDEFGGVKTTTSWQLDTRIFLEQSHLCFQKNDQVQKVAFQHNDLEVLENGCNWNNSFYDHVIFAEGAEMLQNPFFNYLPLRPNKGEVLIIESPELELSDIAMRSVFVLPLGNHQFKVGATYNNREVDYLPSYEGETYLVSKLKALLKKEFKIIDHQAGIRPATHDRRPYLGSHPKHDMLSVFNGFGSKGVSLIPYLADQFADFLLNKSPILPEVDIARCAKYYTAN